MTTTHTALRRIAAGAGAVALSLAGFVAAGTAASADVGPDQPGAPTEGTLTINKYAGGPVDEGQTPDPANLLDGVEFTVWEVGRSVNGTCTAIDLQDAADWDGLEALFASAPALPGGDFCLTNVKYVDETVNGQVVFNLPVGIYVAQETDPGPNNIVSPVPEFYVSIPTSFGEDGAGWNYDVVADPKNQLMEQPSKVITDRPDALVVGSDVTWKMTVPIPTLNNEETFTEAVITDELDSRLDYVANSSIIEIGSTAATEGVHYTVSGDVGWTLTAAGRAVLDANMGQDMTIAFKTTVLDVGDGSIPNAEYESKFNGTAVPGTDIPYSYWGQLKINKKDDSTPAKPLAGAEFKVFEMTAETCPAAVPATGVVATGVSDSTGLVQWDYTDPASSPLSLWVANSNSPLTNPTKDYCLYETVVPAGHTAGVITNPVNIKPGVAGLTTVTVVNAKKDGPDLPLTGAQGTLLLTLGGLALVGAGGGALAFSRRRNNA
ncbi:SpaH/EbpB family LPXTG-anchored major pilin [Flaviflexus huanghaiensis]|uniref:SpaH/EbpB family LPXTG-anchored major pilin n=1 Tax=Flaviflexus huanghaiensis TaxID=1111473 RepID=UPI0015FB239A|nr:SpaH/EbpB family LPXTG-anchored major pilin [Flaviflexus huanghaiensis]